LAFPMWRSSCRERRPNPTAGQAFFRLGASAAWPAAGTVGIRPRSCHVLARRWCFSARRPRPAKVIKEDAPAVGRLIEEDGLAADRTRCVGNDIGPNGPKRRVV
jgi:hypothetical protein